jgi:hypothetical protein
VDKSLTGADIKVSTLGQVPNAANGGTKIEFESSASASQFIPIATIDHLTVGAQCQSFSGVAAILRVKSSVAGSLDYTFTTGLNGAFGGTFIGGCSLSPGSEGTIGQAEASSDLGHGIRN